MSDADEKKLYRLAYMLADEGRRAVLIVRVPRPKYECQEAIPYVVYAADADAWDLKHGERVEPRMMP